MGFPQRAAESSIAICSCHKEAKVGGGYTCPRCKARVCELPTECRICGLTLISSPHLARSYHHLFPIVPFDEVSPSVLNDPHNRLPRSCFGCQQSFPNPGKQLHRMNKNFFCKASITWAIHSLACQLIFYDIAEIAFGSRNIYIYTYC